MFEYALRSLLVPSLLIYMIAGLPLFSYIMDWHNGLLGIDDIEKLHSGLRWRIGWRIGWRMG